MRNYYIRAKFYLAVFVQDSGKSYKLTSEKEKTLNTSKFLIVLERKLHKDKEDL